jgi:hypothetical protein
VTGVARLKDWTTLKNSYEISSIQRIQDGRRFLILTVTMTMFFVRNVINHIAKSWIRLTKSKGNGGNMNWYSVEYSARSFEEQKRNELVFCASDQIRGAVAELTKMKEEDIVLHIITKYDIQTIKGGFC